MLRITLPVCALLALALSACANTGASSSEKSSHTYAFGKPRATNSVASVVAQTAPAGRGPENVATLVYFDFDSDALRPSDRSVVEAHAQWLRQHPERAVVLRGHTDARGGSEYNLALGQRRAQTVKQTLQILGVDAKQLEAVSYGKEQLADVGSNEAAHQRNRRVEFDYR
ncbi:peptidoglycan-associated lipoprotein Pal [Lampropedia aestuarii]|uniref:Peptidoglycan-associated lipoprotein n=2 Tax=Lampropedia aestuarii TaxID=2562762 RepID=A0A4S5BXG2_9BURK|nr:peptidoglycan-associated lipoprotein Pal [Lampropedia aestuarii]